MSGNVIANCANPQPLAVPAAAPFDPPSTAARARLIDGALSAMWSEGAALPANYISIPIAIRYLGAESFGGAANLALSIFRVRRIGPPGAVLATIVSFLAGSVAPQTRKRLRMPRSRSGTTPAPVRGAERPATTHFRLRGQSAAETAPGRQRA